MKDYQALEPRYFKAFMAAIEVENFTSAAVQANMTQSGVSQHIAKLEEQVGLPLFKRIGRCVVVTETGRELAKYIKSQMGEFESFLDAVHEDHDRLSGLVSFAMPQSCLLSPNFPRLLETRKPYSELTFDVTLTESMNVMQKVLDNKIDFGFITFKTDHPLLKLRLFCEEEYILVGDDPEVIKNLSTETIYEHSYIMYTGADVYYNNWLKLFCPDEKKMNAYSLRVSGNINSIDGAIKMACGGLGLGVFPRHCVVSHLEEGRLHEYKTKEKLLNPIYVVTIENHQYPIRIQQIIDWFFEVLIAH